MIENTKTRFTKLGVGVAMALCLSGATAGPALAADPLPGAGCGTLNYSYCMQLVRSDESPDGIGRGGGVSATEDDSTDGIGKPSGEATTEGIGKPGGVHSAGDETPNGAIQSI